MPRRPARPSASRPERAGPSGPPFPQYHALPAERSNRTTQGKPLLVSLAFGPRQTILRPAEIEGSELIDSLTQESLFGRARTLGEAEHVVWRTQAEQDQSPNSYSMGLGGYGQEKVPATLSPAAKPRAALTMDQGHMVDDLTVTLRRIWKDRG